MPLLRFHVATLTLFPFRKMNPKLLLTGLFGLAVLASPVSFANTVAGTPDATVYYESNKVGTAIATLPLLNDVHPSTTARYYIYHCSASWCPPCNKEMPQVVEAYQAVKKSGVAEMLLVAYDYTEEDAHKYIEKYGVMYPAVMSSRAPGLPGFHSPRGIPYTIIVDGEGNVVKEGHGGAIVRDWKAIISAYEKERGLPLSFPEALTRTLTPRRTLASVDTEEAAESAAGNKLGVVADALRKVKWFNGKPALRAEYYIYLLSASWCGPCRAEMPGIAKEYKEMKKDGRVELVLLGGDESQGAAKKFLKANKAAFPGTLLEAKGVMELPGAESFPQFFPSAVIVAADGTVITAGHGSLVMDWRKYTIGASK